MKEYSTDLSDSQWKIIKKYFNYQRKRRYDLRKMLNAIFYLVKTGCQWRLLPTNFPKWQLVYYYFRNWQQRGIIDLLMCELIKKNRIKSGKKGHPSVGIIDSQSVKSTQISSKEHTGYDGGKKIKGIKRHIVVDTKGNLLAIMVHSASVADRKGGKLLLEQLHHNWPGIKMIFADGGYPLPGKVAEPNQELAGYPMTVVKRTELNQFKVIPKRWIVERTFAWMDTNRRNAKSYERLPINSQAIGQLSAIRISLKKI